MLFWFITRIIAAGIIIGCTAVYNSFGITPDSLTSFAGSPTQAGRGSIAYVIMSVLIVTPILEEGVFRLGLSFKKWQVGLSLALIPLTVIWSHYKTFSVIQFVIWGLVATTIFCSIYFGTKQSIWTELRQKYLIAALWITSVAFGLTHFLAFSNLSWFLLPYCLSVVLVPFFVGCACGYLRVNLGFWWGVGMHIFNNLPVLAVMSFM